MSAPLRIKNWQIYLLSFLGAAIFWFFSALGKNYNTRINQPINFVFDQDSLIATKDLPERVNLEVRGLGWDLFRHGFWFGKEPMSIYLDNPVQTKYITRSSLLPLVSDHLDNFIVSFLITDTLFLSIDTRSSKEILIDVDTSTIDLDENYRIVSAINIVPDTAVVYGPTTFLDTLENYYLLAIEERNIDDNFSEPVSLGLPDILDIRSEPEAISVAFDVDYFERNEYQTEIELLNFPEDSSAFIVNKDITIQYVIRESFKEDFSEDEFKVIVDYDMLQKADSTLPAILMIYPENAIEVEILPDSIPVTFKASL